MRCTSISNHACFDDTYLGDDMGLGYYVVDDDDREVHKFLDRSRCLLTTLTITLGWATDQVIALLRRLSTLEELTIGETSPCRYENMRVRHWHRPINRTLLESFRDSRKLPSHPPLIPKLRSLTLKVARQAPYILILAWDEDLVVGAEELEWNLKNGKSVFDRRAFVEMVLSRWDPATTTCIRSISLMLPNSTNVPGKDAEEELEFHPLVPLRKEGLVLDLGII
ncbi:hypothetical protein D9757_006692 [Collybiopsis confluens]|uniref:Uncharacterized protein n=1 Tax=Collybiopsis confluens TaxID=2823264 RepID=A0A8H5MAE1_9AGAR|nr:hypothetical protein D9757_006692 [Collybiopsis confluens]